MTFDIDLWIEYFSLLPLGAPYLSIKNLFWQTKTYLFWLSLFGICHKLGLLDSSVSDLLFCKGHEQNIILQGVHEKKNQKSFQQIIGGLVGWPCHNFLKVREVTLWYSYRSTLYYPQPKRTDLWTVIYEHKHTLNIIG